MFAVNGYYRRDSRVRMSKQDEDAKKTTSHKVSPGGEAPTDILGLSEQNSHVNLLLFINRGANNGLCRRLLDEASKITQATKY